MDLDSYVMNVRSTKINIEICIEKEKEREKKRTTVILFLKNCPLLIYKVFILRRIKKKKEITNIFLNIRTKNYFFPYVSHYHNPIISNYQEFEG